MGAPGATEKCRGWKKTPVVDKVAAGSGDSPLEAKSGTTHKAPKDKVGFPPQGQTQEPDPNVSTQNGASPYSHTTCERDRVWRRTRWRENLPWTAVFSKPKEVTLNEKACLKREKKKLLLIGQLSFLGTQRKMKSIIDTFTSYIFFFHD